MISKSKLIRQNVQLFDDPVPVCKNTIGNRKDFRAENMVKTILNNVLDSMIIIGFCVIFICLTRFCIYKTVNSQAETDNSEKTELPLDLADTDETEDGAVKRRVEQW